MRQPRLVQGLALIFSVEREKEPIGMLVKSQKVHLTATFAAPSAQNATREFDSRDRPEGTLPEVWRIL